MPSVYQSPLSTLQRWLTSASICLFATTSWTYQTKNPYISTNQSIKNILQCLSMYCNLSGFNFFIVFQYFSQKKSLICFWRSTLLPRSCSTRKRMEALKFWYLGAKVQIPRFWFLGPSLGALYTQRSVVETLVVPSYSSCCILANRRKRQRSRVDQHDVPPCSTIGFWWFFAY